MIFLVFYNFLGGETYYKYDDIVWTRFLNLYEKCKSAYSVGEYSNNGFPNIEVIRPFHNFVLTL